LIGNTDRKPTVLKTSAKTGKGIKELASTIDKLLKTRQIYNYKEKEKIMLESELKDMVLNIIKQKVSIMLKNNERYNELVNRLVSKKTDPYQAAEELAAAILG
jgi:LAO/AO transport system kinase